MPKGSLLGLGREWGTVWNWPGSKSGLCPPSQASALLALLLLLDGNMFSLPEPPSGPLEKIFQYIDLHQDEFVQVGEAVLTRSASHRTLGPQRSVRDHCWLGHVHPLG